MKIFGIFAAIIFTLSGFAQSDINKLDDQGKKHGLWKGVHEESKRPRYEGTFEHGKEVGIFKYFDDTKAGTVIATREFNPNDNSAYTIFYNQKKNKVSEGKVVNKLYEGVWKYYHLNSDVVMTLENYKNGKLDGVRKVFYPQGEIAEETHYTNGIKNGPYKKYAVNGNALEEVTFKDGLVEGHATYYDPDGNIASKGLYVKGEKKGIWEFYENGKLVKSEKYPIRKKFQKSTRK